MFKKIEIWILYLTILFSILFAIGFGVLVRQELVGNVKAGWISRTALNLAEIPVNLKKVFQNVIRVEDRFPELSGFSGTPNSDESYLLLSRYDGDLQEGVVELIDLRKLEVLHTWNPDIDSINNLISKNEEFKFLNRDRNNSRALLINPILIEGGGLLFNELTKINYCSELEFHNTKDRFHHAVNIDIDNNIWVPSHLYPQAIPSYMVGNAIREEGGYYDDAVVKLSSDGQILFEKSVSEIFIEHGLEYLLFSVGDGGKFDNDPIHLNDIQPANFDTEYWKKGDVFLSLRGQSMVLLYRPSSNEIIWKGTGPFYHQHDVDILDNHRISIFNNNSKDFYDGDKVDGNNEVIVFDFKTQEYTSYLSESLIENDVRTVTQGLSEILPNGDLFLEETNYGRTLYFNADGSLRWSHVNRAKDGNIYVVGWSRILFTEEDIQTVNNFLNNKGTCNE